MSTYFERNTSFIFFQQQIHVPAHSSSDPRCDICNFTSPSKAVVLQHIRATHYGERYENHQQQNQVILFRVLENIVISSDPEMKIYLPWIS
jgi:hypothetical protein